MNDSQGPPTHYPSSQESTIEIFRVPHAVVTHGGGLTRGPRRARNFSRNDSPRFQPPAYGAENAPPQYNEPHYHHNYSNPQPGYQYHHLLQLQQLQQAIQQPSPSEQETGIDQEEAAKKLKKTMRLRLIASFIIVVVVALVVAGAVGKITNMENHKHSLGQGHDS